jgi:DMSO/TMAO reductase YedYZ molybdopterin-dependent catalytic subunit
MHCYIPLRPCAFAPHLLAQKNANFIPMEDANKLNRVVEARMKLKARFEEKIKQTPSVADSKPMGKGKPNRHGMPSVPVGQVITAKWPVLDLGVEPDIALADWRLVVDGDVEHPVTLTWDDFMALPQTEDTSDFHCVTTWSKLDMQWKGVRLLDIAALVHPRDTATHVLCHGYDDYTTNVSLEEALKPDVLIAERAWRPRKDDYPSVICLERQQMDKQD